MDDIEPVFFERADAAEICRLQIELFPSPVDVGMVSAQLQLLRQQMSVVSKQVSDMIVERRPDHSRQLEEVMLIQEQLVQTLAVSQTARKSIAQASEFFTSGELGVLFNYRHRQILRGVLRALSVIRTLKRTEVRLEELQQLEDFPACIQLLQECMRAAAVYSQYRCVCQMSTRLQDTLDQVEEQLDVGLSKLCLSYDDVRHSRLQRAYRQLGKTQMAADQLLMHFTSAVHSSSLLVLLSHAERCVSAVGSATRGAQLQKRQYHDLCGLVSPTSMLPCLVDLCEQLWLIMYNYHHILQWHQSNPVSEERSPAEDETPEAALHRLYVPQKLEHGRTRIWLDVQGRVKTLLLASDLSQLGFDDFIRVLDVIHKLLEIGTELSLLQGGPLEDAVKQQCVTFFHVYHKARIDELKMFLMNDAWHLCPVKPSFSIFSLQEFKHLRGQRLINGVEGAVSSPQKSLVYFQHYDALNNPFQDTSMDTTADQDTMASGLSDEESEDEPDELKVDCVEEIPGSRPAPPPASPVPPLVAAKSNGSSAAELSPMVSSTTLNLLRLCGKYVRMMSLLRTVSSDVIVCLGQLFDFYLYSVYSLFSSQPDDPSCSPRLRTVLRRIQQQLVEPMVADRGDSAAPCAGQLTLDPSVVPLEALHGLPARLVAAESLVFLAAQMKLLRPHLPTDNSPQNRLHLDQLFGQSVSVVADVRVSVYFPVVSRLLDCDAVLARMSCVNWEVGELCSQHSDYVDLLLADLRAFSARLTDINRHLAVPRPAYDLLWDHCVRICQRTFVEGFGSVTRCSSEGRALMLLDFQHFIMEVERMTRLRPLPDKQLVDVFIKAFYVQETGIEDWVRQHKQYSRKHVLSLVGCMALSKRARVRVTALLDEEDRK